MYPDSQNDYMAYFKESKHQSYQYSGSYKKKMDFQISRRNEFMLEWPHTYCFGLLAWKTIKGYNHKNWSPITYIREIIIVVIDLYPHNLCVSQERTYKRMRLVSYIKGHHCKSRFSLLTLFEVMLSLASLLTTSSKILICLIVAQPISNPLIHDSSCKS